MDIENKEMFKENVEGKQKIQICLQSIENITIKIIKMKH